MPWPATILSSAIQRRRLLVTPRQPRKFPPKTTWLRESKPDSLALTWANIAEIVWAQLGSNQ